MPFKNSISALNRPVNITRKIARGRKREEKGGVKPE
jgi:hypothetical protein